MNVNLTDPIFHDEDKAREWLEASRWPDCTSCPHCCSVSVTVMGGKAHRPGLFHCRDCRGQFTVRTGQVMERSHVPLTKWVLAYHLMASSKKGVSARQLHLMLDVAYNTAWLMAHRIRDAMSDKNPAPIGGEGNIVEADEMYKGKRETPAIRRKGLPPPTKGGHSGIGEKRPILGLVKRGGAARPYHMPQVTAKNVRNILVTKADRKSRLHTDESRLYPSVGKEFATHGTINHAQNEYARDRQLS